MRPRIAVLFTTLAVLTTSSGGAAIAAQVSTRSATANVVHTGTTPVRSVSQTPAASRTPTTHGMNTASAIV